MLDGDGGSGYYVGHLAMNKAIGIARDEGTASVGVRNSNHFGAAAYYVQLAAASRMTAIAMSNSTPKVAAFGGSRPVLGTNPFAFAAPRRGGRSLLLDMATAVASGSMVREYADKCRSLPEGIALGIDGKGTVDAAQVDEGSGALVPFGGAKGYGLALAVEILSGVLTGAGISHGVKSMYRDFEHAANAGHFFWVVDIGRFMALEHYYDRIEILVDVVKESGAGAPRDVRIPGEKRWQAHDRNHRDGIPLDEACLPGLEELAASHGLGVPWSNTTVNSDPPQTCENG